MKTAQEQKLITRQVSRKLQGIKALSQASIGVSSWIDYVRLGLGMSLVQLAKRVGVTQASISASIKLEREGRITLNKLREIADAMECDLVYEFVPRKPIEDIIMDQAMKKTRKLVDETETHMELEDQKVVRDKNERVREIAQEKIYSKQLWD